MANDSVKELLASWKIDNSSWKAAIAEYRQSLKALQQEETARAKQSQTAQKASLAGMQQEIAMSKAIKAEADAVLAQQKAKAQAIATVQAAQQKAAAVAEKASKDQQKATDEQRRAEERLGSEVIAIMRRTDTERKRAAAEEIRRQKEIERATRKAAESGHSESDGISQARKYKDTIDYFMGRATVGPIDVLASKVPGFASLTTAIFPTIGLGIFIGMLAEGITRFKDLIKASKEFPEKMRDAFKEVTEEADLTNDRLRLTDDNLKNQIAKLEHKPVNNLAVAIDEARIKADELAKSALNAYNQAKKLLEENRVSFFDQVFKNTQSTNDSKFNLEGNVKNFLKLYKDAAREMQEALQKGDQGAADLAKKKAQQYLSNAVSYAQTTRKAINAPTEDLQQQVIDANKGNPYGGALYTKPKALDQSARNNVLDYLQSFASDELDRISLNDKTDEDQKKVKDLEEAKRWSQQAIKDAQAELEEKRRQNAAELEDVKARIEQEKALNKEFYDEGVESAQQYYNRKRELSKQTYEATVQDINDNIAAQKKLVELERSSGDISKRQYTAKIGGLNFDQQRQLQKAAEERNKADNETNKEETENTQQGVIKAIDKELDARKKGLALATDATKDAYKQQLISAEEYIATSIKLINQEVEAVRSAELAKASFMKQTDANRMASLQRIQQAQETALKQIQDINQGAISTRLQGARNTYQSQSNVVEGFMSLANSPASTVTQSQYTNMQKEQLDYLTKYQVALANILKDTKEGSADWYETYTTLQKIVGQSELLADTIKNTSNVPGLANMLGAGASAAGTIFNSRYARGLEGSIGFGAQAAGNAKNTIGGIFSGKGLSTSNSLTDNIDIFAKKVVSAANALGSFVQSINSAGSASAGGIGGGIAGAGLGQALGQQASQSSSSVLQALGPFGALIGGALGAAMGAVFGQKQEEVQNDVDKLNASFKSVMNAYSSNNASLAQTILSLQSLIAQAQADAASTKKGGSQFKDLINQYNQQIIQLENQQKQIMTELQNTLVQISAPQAYQTIISSIQDILKQYTQFVGAAQNATELANANNFLTQSLQNLALSYNQQLMSDNEQAIQDALQLNQLYNQRNQLESTYLQQVRSIQGQGTLTRGVTLSQSKYSQLYNLDVNQANSLLDINSQINLLQYKVQAESQVFTLAQTRYGLESQLLQLQKIGVDQDMARIIAMQNTLKLLQTTGYSLTNLGSLNTSDPNALLTYLLQLVASQLGVNPGGVNNIGGHSTAGQLDSAAAGAYRSRVSYGYGAFRGSNII
jgi:hypothetical protein